MTYTMNPLRVKIFADGADLDSIIKHNQNPLVQGFTTNPTLMRKAGIVDYAAFAEDVLHNIDGKPVSFEVFTDDPEEMITQANKIASWGNNVYVKIPAFFTNGSPTYDVVKALVDHGIKVNVTAVFTDQQVKLFSDIIGDKQSYISVFAGRIADAGSDPVMAISWAGGYMSRYPKQELIWASPRQVYDVKLASMWKAHIITVTDDILKKIPTLGKDLEEFSVETCQMFYNDAKSSGFSI
jgi:transaldolase